MSIWGHSYKNYRNSPLISSAKDKILDKNFKLTSKENEEVKACIINNFYQFTDFAYYQLSLKGKDAINAKNKYDVSYWEDYIIWLESLKCGTSVNLFDWLFRTARSNLDVAIWNISCNGDEIEYLPSANAVLACLKNKKSHRQKNEAKAVVASLYGRKKIKKDYTNKIVDYLSPYLFKDKKDLVKYVAFNCHKTNSMYAAYLKLIDDFSEEDNKIVYSKLETILLRRTVNYANKKSLFNGLNSDNLFFKFTQNYNDQYRDKIIKFIAHSDYRDFELNNFELSKKLINLDSSLASYIQDTYIKSIIKYGSSRKRNKDRLVGFFTLVPHTVPKKAVLLLSQANKHNEIIYLSNKFPEIKKLVNFV